VTPLLFDANLSPEVAVFLNLTFGFDAVHLRTRGLAGLPDGDVLALAKREGRVIVTCDLDFGEIYRRWERGQIGVIVLRLENETPASVNPVLARFFRQEAANIDLATSLVVLDGNRTRVVSAN
jgi:predicted nuclease of predicted toxin-antitoxin system